MTEQKSETPPAKASSLLRRGLVAAAVVVAAVLVAGYYVLFMRNHVTTDDAYVNGNLVRLTPQISGTVVAINTDETQYVRQGQVLVELDPRDAQIAVAQAKASLGETVRQVAQLFVEERRDAALVDAEHTQLSQSDEDLARDNSLKAVHGVSLETLEHDENAVRSARAALQQAQASLASTQAEISGTTPTTHPRVLQAEANLRAAWLELTRTHVLAPVSGYVVRRSVELGEQVAPSTEMLALVPVTSMWVDANFKENQLGSLRIGQPVKVTVDMYGSHVDYHGKVLGLTAGTGSALAVLPTENATGNWIKIVQRLPVRIGLDSGELTRHPLFLGLSADINVDVTDLGGSALSQMPAWPAVQHTDVYADQDSGADRMIDAIVSANLGGGGKALYARSAAGTPR
ncbi:MAG TPA: HlyD family efflux transporter periplasmic adaptor subunit [Steroidobacteraceae bacterium]|jgi:membrane fusion protein (multidrug efflux system)|nr:HlyD family efflux transporter periplasmic adaptor subunit [Steroidobacteraceae bacterium]